MLRRGGIGGSVGVWRGSRCPYRPSTASSPDPCPRATSHTVMDYARVDAHPRSMLHWAAKTNHQPLKGRSSHRRYHFNPTLIPHRIVVTHTHRPESVDTRVKPTRAACQRFLSLATLSFSPSYHGLPEAAREISIKSASRDERWLRSRCQRIPRRIPVIQGVLLASRPATRENIGRNSTSAAERGDPTESVSDSALSDQKICLPSWSMCHGSFR